MFMEWNHISWENREAQKLDVWMLTANDDEKFSHGQLFFSVDKFVYCLHTGQVSPVAPLYRKLQDFCLMVLLTVWTAGRTAGVLKHFSQFTTVQVAELESALHCWSENCPI